MRIFCVAHKHNNHWVVEAEWLGGKRIVHSGPSLYSVLRWAKQNGLYDCH